MAKKNLRFHISKPLVTSEHRDAYEEIMGQIQGVLSVCNNGRCKATEATESAQQRSQINDLMDQAERLSFDLVGIIKKFFDQLYCAKEDSARAIALSTAKIKLEMVERNLLERTCDVRWWALEKAFWDCITHVQSLSSLTHQLLNVDGGFLRDSMEKLGWNGDENHHWTLNAIRVLLEEIGPNVSHESEPSEDLINLKEALVMYVDFCEKACLRLEDICSSYTLYRDLVITDMNGRVIANANVDRRSEVLGLDVSSEEWFLNALETSDGTDYRVQDLGPSVIEEEESLVYSTALRKDGDEQGQPIGVMAVFFDFQGEGQLILNDYLPMEGDVAKQGWRSFFTNERGDVICSSDPWSVPVSQQADLPRAQCIMNRPGESSLGTVIMKGLSTLVASGKTEGFDEYKGLGWVSHFTMPEEDIYAKSDSTKDYNLSLEEFIESRLVPQANKETHHELQWNKEDIELISVNGVVLATDLGQAGSSFIPIFDQVTQTGNVVSQKMGELLKEMSSEMLEQNLLALENFSKQAIDLIDRNLFERAADVRWWSSDHVFWSALQNPSEEAYKEASERLGIINGSYTMYRDLVLADKQGQIVASSNTERQRDLLGKDVSTQAWFTLSQNARSCLEYGVQDVIDSELEPDDTSLIYSSSVLVDGKRDGQAAGVIGILFDWDDQATSILEGCLPRDQEGVIEGSAAFYLNKKGKIIATSDKTGFPLGMEVDVPEDCKNLVKGESASGLMTYKDSRYIIGSSRTQGYREYKGMEWSAHVVRPLD